MSSSPRIIAATASAALLAGVGAAGAVFAVETLTAGEPALADAPQADAKVPDLESGHDDSTTVYRQPGSTSGKDSWQPAPPTTQFTPGKGSGPGTSTSHSS
jgi:hypothetical protein